MAADPDKTLVKAFGAPGDRPAAPAGAPPLASAAVLCPIGLPAA